jgi:hypothetical protein
VGNRRCREQICGHIPQPMVSPTEANTVQTERLDAFRSQTVDD